MEEKPHDFTEESNTASDSDAQAAENCINEVLIVSTLRATQQESQYDPDEIYAEGYVHGYISALEEGVEDEYIAAYAECFAEGFLEGYAQGYAEATVEVAKDMLADGLEMDVVAEMTDLGTDQLHLIKKSME